MIFKLGLCQMKGSEDKIRSIETAEEMVKKAAYMGADIISLPEMFNCPYDNSNFRMYAENESGITVKRLSKLASEEGIYLIGGSIPELDGENVYNTCFCFDKNGNIAAKHRKIHLFNIDIEGGIRFMESETLTAGDKMTIFNTEYCDVGIAICFDVRFPELFRRMALEGANLVVLPAAFNMTTGPAHWDLTMRARALDNQIYFAACSPARSSDGGYMAYGHSCIVNPWGDFSGKLDANQGVLIGDINLDYLEKIRSQLPLLSQRKPEVY